MDCDSRGLRLDKGNPNSLLGGGIREGDYKLIILLCVVCEVLFLVLLLCR